MIRPGTVRQWGVSLGSVLLLTMVVLLIGVSIAALSSFQLGSAQEARNAKDAELLADSAINYVASKLTLSNGTFGQAPSDGVTFQPDATDTGRQGIVTFNPGIGLPYSTNNMNPAVTGAVGPTTSAIGFQGVPTRPYSVRVLAIGHSHGLTRGVEADIRQTLFPYALACGGVLNFDTLTVGGVGSLANFVSSNAAPTPVLPASIALIGGGSIGTSNPLTVSGNVYSSAGATVGTGSTVGGVVKQMSGLALPSPNILGVGSTFPAAGIIPAAMAAATSTVPAPGPFPVVPPPSVGPGSFTTSSNVTTTGPLALNQAVVSIPGAGFFGSHALTVTGGDLTLNQSVLCVGGNLTISGNLVLNHGMVYATGAITTNQIKGSGVVVCGSSVTFSGLSAVDYYSEVAILAQGAVTVTGVAPGPAFFQGLIYSGDTISTGLTASNMTLAGVFVSQGQVNLHNSVIWHIPTAAVLTFAAYSQPAPASNPAVGTATILNTSATPEPFTALTFAPATASFFSAADMSQINAMVRTMTGDPAYSSQISGGIVPLATATVAPSFTVTLQGLVYEPGVNRYRQTFPPIITYQQGGAPVPRAIVDQAAQKAHTSTEDLVAGLDVSQSLVAVEANCLLANYEMAALTQAPAAQILNVSLNQYLPAGYGPYNVVSWRVH